jgi:hypothetical protein
VIPPIIVIQQKDRESRASRVRSMVSGGFINLIDNCRPSLIDEEPMAP